MTLMILWCALAFFCLCAGVMCIAIASYWFAQAKSVFDEIESETRDPDDPDDGDNYLTKEKRRYR